MRPDRDTGPMPPSCLGYGASSEEVNGMLADACAESSPGMASDLRRKPFNGPVSERLACVTKG